MNRAGVTKVFVLSILSVMVTSAYPVGGWGGLGVAGMMVDVEGLNDNLTTINREILGGSQTVEFGSPFYFIGGQGGGEIGLFSLGAWGGGLFSRTSADALSASLGYAIGSAELGLGLKPADWVWIRPCLDAGGAVFALELTEIGGGEVGDALEEPYRSSLRGWQANAGAALAIQFNLPLCKRSLVGLMIQTGYLYPVYISWRDQDGSEIDPIEGFGMHGVYLRAGINLATRGSPQRVMPRSGIEDPYLQPQQNLTIRPENPAIQKP
ncbi:hypothetical protein CEE36_03585 [candidate division TA06 bacterium B3_TA06]|uniref:Outer membrane protein beta-barrel domain-containing protein n=1 Tax=candidate division TA06 bacterium B3_TA06 TaxID=2012487 RepID=A0A532V8X0_UNCT6|nr:MAG: hypothetical protein CEE36_03585 [candidate division TA06 bacterium B3_TA06]